MSNYWVAKDQTLWTQERYKKEVLKRGANLWQIPVLSGGHFFWGEVFWAKSLGKMLKIEDACSFPYRQLTVQQILNNIVFLAEQLEDVRHVLGDHPLSVTCWLRTNEYRLALVKNGYHPAEKSIHHDGCAIDFIHAKYSAIEVRSKIKNMWKGRAEINIPWVHLDTLNWGKQVYFNP